MGLGPPMNWEIQETHREGKKGDTEMNRSRSESMQEVQNGAGVPSLK